MTQIFFYHGAGDRIAAIAGLVARAHAQRKPLLVYAPDPVQAQAIDRALWTLTPTGFIPHVRLSSPLAAETPILIAEKLDAVPAEHAPCAGHDRLINLSDELPPGFARFASLIEVVSEAPEVRLPARERYKFYKDRGYEIRTHDLTGRA